MQPFNSGKTLATWISFRVLAGIRIYFSCKPQEQQLCLEKQKLSKLQKTKQKPRQTNQPTPTLNCTVHLSDEFCSYNPYLGLSHLLQREVSVLWKTPLQNPTLNGSILICNMVQMNAILLLFPLHKRILLLCAMLSCCHDILSTVGLFTLILFSQLTFNPWSSYPQVKSL